ncbi:MAG: substrate-binding domain-containing protein [Paludibacter sp.]|nr:substrate-binding domain-containing protein [Paludibacter sp.]
MSKFRILLALFVITLVSCQTKSNDKFTDTYGAGSIPMAVDASFEPIIKEEIAVFQAEFPNASIKPVFTDEVSAIDLLMKDSVRVAVVTRPLSEKEINYLKEKRFSPRSYRLATDGIALIVNNSNPDTLMSVVDLRRILKGEVKNWKDIYPTSKLGGFKVVFDNTNSSTVRYAIDSICLGKPISNELNAQHTNAEVIKYVSKTPNAIGVVAVNWLDNAKDTTNMTFNSSIRVMSVSAEEVPTPEDSYKPFQYYLYYGNYPLARTIYVILNDPRGSLPSSITNFMTSDRGQRIILKTGLVPATQPIRIVSIKGE